MTYDEQIVAAALRWHAASTVRWGGHKSLSISEVGEEAYQAAILELHESTKALFLLVQDRPKET